MRLARCILVLLSFVALQGCDGRIAKLTKATDSPNRKIKFSSEIPAYYSDGLTTPLTKYPVPFDKVPTETPFILVPEGAVNIAKGKSVTCSKGLSVICGSLEKITDGDKRAIEGCCVEFDCNKDTKKWVQIDLGQVADIYGIWLWHKYSTCGYWLLYEDVVIQVASDSNFSQNVTTVFNNDYNGSSGFGIGKDMPYLESRFGRAITIAGIQGRHVRVYGAGDCIYGTFGLIELEVYGYQATETKNGEQVSAPNDR